MTADFFTKPLQGSQFKKFQDQIMNVQEDDPTTNSTQDHRSVLEQSDGDIHTTDGWTMVNSKELRKQMLSKQTGKIPLKTHG
jgi:hypothetical protein